MDKIVLYWQRRLSESMDILEKEVNKRIFKPEMMIDKAFEWLYRNLLPQLTVASFLIVIIIFSVPEYMTASKWFWIKDPLSVIAGCILVWIYRKFRQII